MTKGNDVKVYVVTAYDHLKRESVCKVFSSKNAANKFEAKLILATHEDVGDRYSKIDSFQRTVDCPEAV